MCIVIGYEFCILFMMCENMGDVSFFDVMIYFDVVYVWNVENYIDVMCF